jgi:hypothetical protein
MYAKQTTNVFKGLNSEIAPDLINEGEARDILNFRMNEVGKLVNRNGYYIGLESDSGYPYEISGLDSSGVLFNQWEVVQSGNGLAVASGIRSSAFIDVTSHVNSNGIVGLGEYIFADYWDAIDSDRVMVYFVRAGYADGFSGAYSHKGTYLFSPTTGSLANKLLVSTSLEYGVSGFHFEDAARKDFKCVTVIDKKDVNINGVDFKGSEQLYAPNRGTVNTIYISGNCYFPNGEVISGIRPDPWINDYVDMHEYKHKLVISDRTNGDLMLEDEYDREQYDGTYGQVHELRLRDNTLDLFDIDCVEVDLRFDSGAENDKYSGVNTAMGLYGYEFDKKWTKTTVDHFSDTISNMDWLENVGEGIQESRTAKIIEEYLGNDSYTTFLNTYVKAKYTSDKRQVDYTIHHYNNTDLKYVFSNSDVREEFDDLLSIPKFKKDELDDLKYADSYIWEDYKLNYHPTIGAKDNYVIPTGYEADVTHYMLNEVSREFEKLDGLKTRITEIKKHGRYGEEVPLGVWRYRFVWDLGGGQYSAPSAEMLIPDIMWSATKDEDMVYNTSYDRPLEMGGLRSGEPYHLSQFTEPKSGYVGLTNDAYYNPYPKFFENNDTELSDFGQKFYDLKQQMYSGMNHRFAPDATNYDISGWTHDEKGELSTLITGVSTPYVKYNGIFYEAVSLWDDDDDDSPEISIYEDSKFYNRAQITESNADVYTSVHSLYLPIFKTEGKSVTYNSLCDVDGRVRLAYANDDVRKYEIVTGGTNAGFGYHYTIDHFPRNIYEAMALRFPDSIWGKYYNVPDNDFYFNLLGVSNADRDDDWNNKNPIVSGAYDFRPNTSLRIVKEDSEDLMNTDLAIQTQARNRLIQNGIINIEINPPQMDIYSEKIYIHGDMDSAKIAVMSGDMFAYDMARLDYTGTLYDVNIHYNLLGDKEYTGFNHRNFGDNLTLENYFAGTRLMLPEQLTAVFPSSVLFKAPRIGFKIENAKVPARAKRLLIFRTLSSHNNDYQPTQYGLVEEVPIKREGDIAITEMLDKTNYSGCYYFDKIKDEELDFSVNISDYDGLTDPLKSRFNVALNERMYYANLEETYSPKPIRKHELESGISGYGDFMYPDTHYETFMCTASGDDGFEGNKIVKYRYLYKDNTGVYSDYKETSHIETSGVHQSGTVDKYAVVLYTIPSKYDDSIKEVEVYRTKPTATLPQPDEFFYVGKVEPDDEGIFVDAGLTGKQAMPVVQRDVHNYESAFRYSEAFLPDKIKADAFGQVKEGDGDQVTGLASLYGNLVIFKENSTHRMAVQGRQEPISRTDELTPNIGCIAPNTLINIDNVLYFLSWEGLMRYDNNQFSKIDGKFNEELQFRLQNAKEKIRDASCAYNPTTSELYLNIPIGCNLGDSDTHDTTITYFDNNSKFKHDKRLLGHVYVVNLLHQYATKYSYLNTGDVSNELAGNYPMPPFVTTANDSQQVLRKYFTNSLGELRSADILPKLYGNFDISGVPYSSGERYKTAQFYIETPYKAPELYKGTDSVLYNNADYGKSGNYETLVANEFPHKIEFPIKNIYRSKFYDMNNGTVNKRIRDNNFDIYSEGFITIKTSTENNYDKYFNKIEHEGFLGATDYAVGKEDFNPTVDYASGTYYEGYPGKRTISGTHDNFIRIVNETPRMGLDANGLYKVDDRPAKGKQYHIDIETEGYTYLAEYNFYWRMIHSHIR